MSRLHQRDQFWAGGSAKGWFVNFTTPLLDEQRIAWFNSQDHGSELAAAMRAETLAAKLNRAVEESRGQALRTARGHVRL